MNMWVITGIVVFKGQKRNERAPWPCIVESDGGPKGDPTTRIPVDIFGDVEVGQLIELSGILDSMGWNGKTYPRIVVKRCKIEVETQERKPIRRYPEDDQPPSRNCPPMPEIDGEFSEDNIPF